MQSLQRFGPKVKTKKKSFSVKVYGGKGAHLMEMSKAGLPVPEGIVIPTSHCKLYLKGKYDLDAVVEEVFEWAEEVRDGQGFSLFSVRSGAPVSMPGMMDTILNVGLSKGYKTEALKALGAETMWDCQERLEAMFLDVVGTPVPSTFREQLRAAIASVFKSWGNDRAKAYRKHEGISETMGTAVVIQRMVFGNLGEDSCSGVCFTRNPSTGERVITGEYLPNAQGEDVVAGTSTPLSLSHMADTEGLGAAYLYLGNILRSLENKYKDMQDVEFTVEKGNLYILQTRTAKRTAKAAIKIAVDMVGEGLITEEAALGRITGKQFLLSRRPAIDPSFSVAPTFTGLPACTGVVAGVVGESILVAAETTPNDISKMIAAKGILTQTGGATSHAAVVARSLDTPCITGIAGLLGKVAKGDKVVMDGGTGNVWVGVDVPIIDGSNDEAAQIVIGWALGILNVNRLSSRLHQRHTVVATADWLLGGNWEQELSDFRDAVAEIGADTVVLDLTHPDDYAEPEDAYLLGMFGGYDARRISANRVAIMTSLINQPIEGLCVVNSPLTVTYKAICEAGMVPLREVTNVADVLEASKDGVRVRIGEGFSAACGSDRAAQVVLDSFGATLTVVKRAVSEVDAVLAVLGGCHGANTDNT